MTIKFSGNKQIVISLMGLQVIIADILISRIFPIPCWVRTNTTIVTQYSTKTVNKVYIASFY